MITSLFSSFDLTEGIQRAMLSLTGPEAHVATAETVVSNDTRPAATPRLRRHETAAPIKVDGFRVQVSRERHWN